MNISMFKHFRKVISLTMITVFVGSFYIPQAQAGEMVVPVMPVPGTRVSLSSAFTPAHLKGITIHPDNALKFDFLIHKGDGNLDPEQKNQEYKKLVKYFLASLTIPDEDQWVNLSPYEKDRMVAPNLGQTAMGRDMLAQDYMLKQLTASLIYPESGLGRVFWGKVYQRAYKEYGTTNVPVNTFNKVWIVPDEAIVYESGNTAYVLKSHLKVMLEEDYLALSRQSSKLVAGSWKEKTTPSSFDPRASSSKLGSQVIREIILPEIEKEVNEGKNFANLRQIVSGMILATWYKKALKESLLGKIYADKAKVKGVDQDPKSNEKIYQKYLAAFKKGVYNYIKEDFDQYTNQTIPRKYFAGGFENTLRSALNVFDSAMTIPSDMADLAIPDNQLIVEGNVDRAEIALDEKIEGPQGFVSEELEDNRPIIIKYHDGPITIKGKSSLRIRHDGDHNFFIIDQQGKSKILADDKIVVRETAGDINVGSLTIIKIGNIIQIRENLDKNAKKYVKTKTTVTYMSSFEIGEEFTSYGHKIDGGQRTKNSNEEIVVDFARDRNLQNIYQGVEASLNKYPDLSNLPGEVKGGLIGLIVDETRAQVKFVDSHPQHVVGNTILVGDTIETGGVCRHMALIIAAIVEQFIKRGVLKGWIYFVVGYGHAWAVYETSSGEPIELDGAQDGRKFQQGLAYQGLFGYYFLYSESYNQVKRNEQKAARRRDSRAGGGSRPTFVHAVTTAIRFGQNLLNGSADNSSISSPGGIDLNSANLNLRIKRDGKGMPLPLARQDMASLSRVQGFEPEIIEIKSVTALPILNELQQKLRSPQAAAGPS